MVNVYSYALKRCTSPDKRYTVNKDGTDWEKVNFKRLIFHVHIYIYIVYKRFECCEYTIVERG